MSDDHRHPGPAGDERPRPQYGEYATPDEQRAHTRMPPPLEAPAPSPAPVSDGTRPQDAPAAPAAGHPRSWDRVLTLALLALGLFNVLSSMSAYLHMDSALSAAFAQLGVGDFGAADIAAPAGVALAVIQPLLWLITAALAVTSLRRGRISFWIPLVGGVVAYIVLVVVLVVVVLNDPAFVSFVQTSSARL
ncbi:DUF6264 family protein [Microbacterium sp. STN6]|uniref:DUF6264 family protein n=1 Tax=Microbacterium sp. STN6 TaxID=2995588 RepID=UPI0022609857|nr:DUF6264 family protein [Microbacterium sp. STN6]MCX7521875.1 DUF6264 family protein [Microbacterium sp. STN6]